MFIFHNKNVEILQQNDHVIDKIICYKISEKEMQGITSFMSCLKLSISCEKCPNFVYFQRKHKKKGKILSEKRIV